MENRILRRNLSQLRVQISPRPISKKSPIWLAPILNGTTPNRAGPSLQTEPAALTNTGDGKGAATHLEIAVARLPEMMDAHARRSYQHLGRVAEAKKEQQRVQQLQATKARVPK